MVFGSEVEQLAKEGNPASQYAFAFEEMLLNPNIVSEWLIISALQGHYKAAHYLKNFQLNLIRLQRTRNHLMQIAGIFCINLAP